MKIKKEHIQQIRAIFRKRQLDYLQTKHSIIGIFSARKYDENETIKLFHEKLNSRGLTINPKEKGLLNIFYAGTDYSQDYSGFIQGLEKFGHVHIFKNELNNYGILKPRSLVDKETLKSNSENLFKQVKSGHNNKKIDLFLGQLLSNYIYVDTLIRIQDLGIPVINISLDDLWLKNWEAYRGYKLGARGLIKGTDLLLCSTSRVVKWYHNEECLAIYSPMASSSEIFYPRQNKIYDVSFVGGRYGIRQKSIRTIEKNGIKVDCFGPGWDNGRIASKVMADIFGKSKIILGIGYAGYNKNITTLKNRDFDATLSGALYLTTPNPDLLNLFKPDKDLVIYNNFQDCANKIKYYLNHDHERQQISEAGYNKALKYHTWEIRFGYLFKRLNLIK